MVEWAVGKPEEAGISSGAVLSFLKYLERQEVPMHSVLLYRRQKVILEAYYRPFEKQMLHRMYSVTKSFVSLAVGLLADKGEICLDDPIIKYYGEYVSPLMNSWILAMTIRDMLQMKTCHGATTYKQNPKRNWVESFFTVKPDHQPGKLFSYDTSSSHTLCALVEKITCMPLLDYLRKECLDEIDFSKEAYIIKDPFGVSMGGSGLMAKSRDILKVGILLMNQGKWEGHQLLPAWYLKEAVAKQTATAFCRSAADEKQGYGYQFWRLRHDGFASYGMGGQYILCFPKQDLLCVTTADTLGIPGGSQKILDAVHECILPQLDLEGNECADELEIYINGRCIDIVPQGDIKGADKTMRQVSGRRYRCVKEEAGISEIGVDFSEDRRVGHFYYKCSYGLCSLAFGIGELLYSEFPYYGQKCAASAGWEDDYTLNIRIQMIGEELSSVAVGLVFANDRITACMRNTGEWMFHEFSGFFEGICK